MDKVKKVLVYQFWILLSIALLLPLIGWSSATSGLKEETEKRKKDIDSAFSTLPKGENPNKTWVDGVNAINVDQEQKVTQAWQALWDRQQKLMTWPKDFPNDPALIPADQQARFTEIYRQIYVDEFDITRNTVNPLTYDEAGAEVGGIVDFPKERLFMEDWGTLPPTMQQMIEAQEDQWFLRAILNAIAETNKDARVQYDANVRQIIVLKLRGGGGPKGAAAGSAGMPGGAMPGAGDAAMVAGAMGPGMGGGGVSAATVAVDFDPSDEFGAERPDPASAAAAAPAGGPGGPAMAGAPGMGMPSNARMLRYIEETENPKWKTRGFYLKVAVHQMRIPELLANLGNQAWPITITRVNQMDLYPEDLAEAVGNNAGRGGFAPGGAMGGFAQPGVPAFAGAEVMPGMGANAAQGSAMADPNLAIVAISGKITFFKPPPAAQGTQAPGTAAPGTPAPATAGAVPADSQAPMVTAGAPAGAPPAGAPVAAGAAPVTPAVPGAPVPAGPPGAPGTPPAAATPAPSPPAAAPGEPASATPPTAGTPAAPGANPTTTPPAGAAPAAPPAAGKPEEKPATDAKPETPPVPGATPPKAT